MLASSNFLSSCETPIVSCHKVVFDCQAIELEEFSKLNLSHNCDVEVPEGLNLRIKRLSVFVEFVHVLVFELIGVVGFVLNVIKLRLLFAQVIFFKVNHY